MVAACYGVPFYSVQNPAFASSFKKMLIHALYNLQSERSLTGFSKIILFRNTFLS